jgi:spore maturation protein CgeB
LRGYFDGIIEAQVNVYGYNFLKDVISKEAIEEFSKCANWNSMGKDYNVSDKEIVINEFIGKKCAEVERHRFIDKLAKNFKFDLYTLSNTEKMPYIINKGPADSRIDMPKIFKCSKINVNMTIKTIESGIPLRIYDIMGNGGFVLTNYQSELSEYFIPNEDFVIYESLEDLIFKISYYLQHEEERKSIADNGYRKVKSLYTVEKRLEQIFEIVFQDKSKCYGKNSDKSQKEYLSLIHLFRQLNITRILDAGLFLNSNNSLVKQYGIELENKYIVDGVQLINDIKCNTNDTMYKNIYYLNNLPNDYYDLIIIIDVFRYLKDEEIICLLKHLSQLAKTIIVDYKEEYIIKLNGYKEYNIEKLEMGDCELLLIIIN